jgi:hypothetical protein
MLYNRIMILLFTSPKKSRNLHLFISTTSYPSFITLKVFKLINPSLVKMRTSELRRKFSTLVKIGGRMRDTLLLSPSSLIVDFSLVSL